MKCESVKIYGYFWFGGNFFKGAKGENKLRDIINKNRWNAPDFLQVVSTFDGSWSIIIKNDNTIFASVDRVSSRPLFYSVSNDILEISNRIKNLSSNVKDKFQIDTSLKSFYIKNKCTPIGTTLFSNVLMIPPGSCISYIDHKVNILTFSGLKARKAHPAPSDKMEAIYNIKATISQMCNTLEQINPENIYVPLSGGMDSRIIAFGLSQSPLLKQKVKCYTYGRSKEEREAVISKSVADELGLSWDFIKYTKEAWEGLRNNLDSTFSEFDLAASFPHMQEYIASREMVKNNGSGIFVPGYCLDVPVGSHIYQGGNYQRKFIKEARFLNKYKLDDMALNYETVFLMYRLSKTVIPSVRNYELNSTDFILPFWSNHIYDYWYSRPYYCRQDRKLFILAIEHIYSQSCPELNNINYANYAPVQDRHFLNLAKEMIFGFLHNIYSLSFVNKLTRVIFKDKIVRSNKSMDYLGLYDFCQRDNFSTELEFKHYHNRIAEISYNYLLKKP